MVSLVDMLVFVYLGMKGASSFKSEFPEYHEMVITGAVLIALDLRALFIKF
jgi:hypothetical protein